MLRRCLSAAIVLFIVGGFVLAETGVITAVDVEKGEITIKVRKNKEDKEGTDKTIKTGKKIVFKEQKGKDDPTALEDYDIKKLSAAVEKAAKAEKGPKGVRAKVETEDDTTTITIIKRGKKK